jgi:hypothetical protein
VGAWRSNLQFQSGTFASIKDLAFLYVFNEGGTTTESSSYDAAPPVPPAYGIWRQVGPGWFEAKYVFFVTKPPARLDEITAGAGWLPSGYGVFTESLHLAEDGQSLTSTIAYEAFDASGKQGPDSGRATARGVRIAF